MKRVQALIAALGMLLGLAWVVIPATPAGAVVTGVVRADGTMTGGTSVGTAAAPTSSSFVGTWHGPVNGTTLSCQLNGDLGGNQSISSGSVVMTWSCTNGPIEIYCSANGNRLGNEIGARGRCSGDAVGENEVTLNWAPTTAVPVTRYHLSGHIVIRLDNAASTGPSSLCNNEIHSGTTAGVFTRLAYQVIDSRNVAVCYRIASADATEGGRVIVTLPDPDPGSINPPLVDDEGDACTTTLADGRLLGNDELAYFVGVTTTGDVSVCVELGASLSKRVVISTDVIEPPTGLVPGVTLERDPA